MVKIAIIDDDPSVRKGLGRLLRFFDYEVVAYESAEAFLESMSGGPPECIILDLNLSGMNGLELLDTLRKFGSTIPAVIITAEELPAVANRAKALLSASDRIPLLQKPFDAQVLLSAMSEVLEPLH